jgi:hypothetical protein
MRVRCQPKRATWPTGGDPKSHAGRRVVHLPAGLVDELKQHVLRFTRPDPEGFVFTAARGAVLR